MSTENSWNSPIHPSLRTLFFLWLACWGIYHVNFRVFDEIDTVPAPYVAWSLVQHRDFDLTRYKKLERNRGGVLKRTKDGRWMSKYPPGKALAMVPFVAPVALILDDPPRHNYMRRLGKLMGAAFTSGAVVCFYLLLLDHSFKGAVLATLLFAFGTNLFSIASQASWAHGPALFFATVGCRVFLLLAECSHSRNRKLFFLLGLCIGIGTTCRQPVSLFAVSICCYFVFKRRPLDAALVGLGSGIPLLMLLWYNHYFWGNWLTGGYGMEGTLFTSPLSEGISGLLVSPSRGLLVFSPALVLSLIGLSLLFRWRGFAGKGLRGAVVVLIVASLGQMVLYAKWKGWAGGWSYGPRLLIETLPIWCLLFAIAYEYAYPYGLRRKIAVFLVILSIAVHAGIFIAGRRGYKSWHRRLDQKQTTVWNIQDNLILSTLSQRKLDRGSGFKK